MMKRLYTLVALFTFAAVPASADVPRTLSLQGILTGADAMPVEDGNHAVTFRLYAAPEGGSPVWSEARTIETAAGLFTVTLGAVTPLDLPFDVPYYAGVALGDDPEMTPRFPLASVPYSFRAAAVEDSSVTGASIAAGQVVTSLNGLRDGVYLTGAGGASVTANGDTLVITASGGEGATGVQSVQSTNNTLTVTNPAGPTVTVNVRNGGIGTAQLADGAVTGDKVAPGTLTADRLQAGQVVTGLNGLRDMVYLAGAGGASVTQSGDTLVITAAGGDVTSGIQSLQSTNGTLSISNPSGPTVTLNVASGGIGAAQIADGAVSSAKVADGTLTNVDLSPAAAIAENKLALAFPTHTSANDPSAGEKAALAGTAGTPGDGNRYVTNADPRLNDPAPAWNLAGNAGTDTTAQFLGTTDNRMLSLRVNNTRALRLEPGTALGPNVIGGSPLNSVQTGVGGATIGGGGKADAGATGNRVTDHFGVVGGGASNRAGDASFFPNDALYATVAGGLQNIAGHEYSSVSGGQGNETGHSYATVGGGFTNKASGLASTVGGGQINQATGENSVVAGGAANLALSGYATIAGGQANLLTGVSSTIGGGSLNRIEGANYATVGGGERDSATASHATVGGGKDNAARGEQSFVGGGRLNRANGLASVVSGGVQNTTFGDYATISGGDRNRAFHFASVGGGGRNEANGSNSTIAGGRGNIAEGNHSAIGGGENNRTYNNYGTVGGGVANYAGYLSTVAGGSVNKADTVYAAIGGGHANLVTGFGSTVPGGRENTVTGDYAFAAGRRAKALHNGSFVLTDDTDADFASTAARQFLIRTGSVGVNTNTPVTALHVVRNINANAQIQNHVSVIENTSTGTSTDILALVTGAANPGTGASFLSILGAGVRLGGIVGNGSGGMTFQSLGADYAEWLPRLDPTETIRPGDVVGVFAGRITKRTAGADHLLVVSDQAIVTGNMPDEETAPLGNPVSFIGQVAVSVAGPVRSGDVIVPSGREDGTAVALNPATMAPRDLARMIGRAWEASHGPGVTRVTVAVGLPVQGALLDRLASLEERIARLEQVEIPGHAER